MRLVLALRLACLGVGLTGSSASIAQGAGDLTIEVGECIDLKTDAERHACYDRQVESARARGAESAGEAEIGRSVAGEEPIEVAEPTPSAPVAARSADATAEPAASPETEQVVSVIAELAEGVPNQHVITLENGQTWRQQDTERYRLRVGDRVTLSPTRWGTSYRLKTENASGFIQVERIR